MKARRKEEDPLKKPWFYLALAAILVVIDQWVKSWIVANFALYETRPFLPGLLELTRIHNTGGAWSIFNQHTWVLAIISGLVSLVLVYLIIKPPFPQPGGRLALAMVLGGAVGNLIDRVRLGYVVDMFHFLFVNFPVFNVADIGVSLGGVALCIYVAFFWGKEGKP